MAIYCSAKIGVKGPRALLSIAIRLLLTLKSCRKYAKPKKGDEKKRYFEAQYSFHIEPNNPQ
jgi:hypothetical protein